ncbi:MAG: hypothetical protein IPN61_09125 [Bacteroidetes bacterium]|nr:hypothetical protein [Bacteroidota bacterium]
MNEKQIKTIIDLLENISDKLNKIDSKISENYNLTDVYSKISDISEILKGIEEYTSNLNN